MNYAYTTNPLTGNLIKVGGPVYKELLRNKATKKLLLAGHSPARRSVRRSSQKRRSVFRMSNGRGSRTRGWREASPARGRERSVMKQRCGSKCFLSPAKNKYPICRRNTCKPDCRGIISAKVRAGQYKETSVMALAKKLEKLYC